MRKLRSTDTAHNPGFSETSPDLQSSRGQPRVKPGEECLHLSAVVVCARCAGVCMIARSWSNRTVCSRIGRRASCRCDGVTVPSFTGSDILCMLGGRSDQIKIERCVVFHIFLRTG